METSILYQYVCQITMFAYSQVFWVGGGIKTYVKINVLRDSIQYCVYVVFHIKTFKFYEYNYFIFGPT